MPSEPRNEMHGAAGPEVGRLEFEARVLYSLLAPAVRFAHRCRIPVDRVTEMATLAYLSDVRRSGSTLKEAAGMLGKSLRTVNTIAKRLHRDFFSPEEAHGLPRLVEYHLAVRPHTLPELLESLATDTGPRRAVVDRAQLEDALDVLVSECRIAEDRTDGQTTYRVASNWSALATGSMARRIDGLNDLLDSVLQTVTARFFGQDDRAFARTLTFAATDNDVLVMRKEVYDLLRLRASDLEDAAADAGLSGQKYSVVFCITPLSGEEDR